MGTLARRCSRARARLGAAWRPRHHVRGGGAVEDRARDRRRVAWLMPQLVAFQEGMALSRLTTIGTGGPAGAYAEPRTLAELEHVLRAGRDRGLRVATVGLGSNLLAADAGVDMLVLRLTGELAEARAEGTVLVAGGGATQRRLPPPRSGGGARRLRVRVRDPGDGRRWRLDECRRLRPRLERDPRARARRDGGRDRLADSRRARALVPAFEPAARSGRRRRRVPADAARTGEIRAEVRELVDRRKATQPTTKRTFGSVFKNPPGEIGAGEMLELCGLKGYRRGGAVISPKHANFIENAGGATTADCLALMAEARRRVARGVRRRTRARGRAAR